MHYGHGSWIILAVFGATFAIRYLSSQRRRGTPPPGSSFTSPGSRGPAPGPTAGSQVTVGRDTAGTATAGTATAGTATAGTATAGTAPAWFTDPFFKHEHRYWSGTEWTEHVSDNGVPGTDPPPQS